MKVVDTSEVNYGAGVAAYTFNAQRSHRITMQAVWANYTAVTVKLQASLDNSNWSDVSGMSITVSGSLVSGNVGPFEWLRVHITATLSGSTDTMKVWFKESADGY